MWFALTCRTSGITASKRLNLDGVAGYNIDSAVTLRLLHFDAQQGELQAQRIAYEVSKIFASGEEGGGGGGDYGEADAVIW